jgi:hypothetical protein
MPSARIAVALCKRAGAVQQPMPLRIAEIARARVCCELRLPSPCQYACAKPYRYTSYYVCALGCRLFANAVFLFLLHNHSELSYSILQPIYSPLAAWTSAPTKALTRRTSARLQASSQGSTVAKQTPAAAAATSNREACAASSKRRHHWHHWSITTPSCPLHCTQATRTTAQQQQPSKGATTREGTAPVRHQCLRCPLQSTLEFNCHNGGLGIALCTAWWP